MKSRILLPCLAILAALQTAESFGQLSQTSSYYLSNRSREIRRSTSASYFMQRSSTQSILNRAAPRYNYSSVGNNVFAGVQQKPFSNASPGPLVSPYLGLGGVNIGSVPNYYSVVRPQLDQQRQNQRVQQQRIAQQQELTQMAARSPFAVTGSEGILPTGHIAAFMNYFGYYPQPAPQRRR